MTITETVQIASLQKRMFTNFAAASRMLSIIDLFLFPQKEEKEKNSTQSYQIFLHLNGRRLHILKFIASSSRPRQCLKLIYCC